jgi:glycerophosphoryl diester phosphodiesterase
MLAPPLLLGHRGTRVVRTVPENSVAAFDHALSQGCDGFEFDVRSTADGVLVVVHDAKSRGVTIAKSKQSRLANLPQLGDVLEKYGPRGFLDIELKVDGLEPSVLRLLREHPPVRGYVVSSFLPSVVLELRARRGALPLGIICDTPSQLRRGLELPMDYMILEQALVEEDLVKEIRSSGRRLLVWTVNKPEAMHRLARWRVDGIISDDPGLLARTLSAQTAKSEMPRAKKVKRAPAKAVKKVRRRGKN